MASVSSKTLSLKVFSIYTYIGISQLTNMLGYPRETFYGRTWDVVSLHDAKNIAYTNVSLGLHMDLL